MDRNYESRDARARARERERQRPPLIIVQDKRFENCQEVSGIKVKGGKEKERGIGDNEVFQPGVETPRGEGVTNPRRLRSCEPPANPARLDDTSNYVNSRCIEPSGTSLPFWKAARIHTATHVGTNFFFFFLSDPCTLAHTQGSLESLRFRFKQCAFCPSLRFPTEILSLVERFFFPFLFPQTILDNVCRPIL